MVAQGRSEKDEAITETSFDGASDDAPQICVSPEVAEALRSKKPVVALESTIIAHGMPYPQNLETANVLEATVRANGAIPATVAVLHGVPHVGLSSNQLLLLALPSSKVLKLAQRDLPLALARGAHGATTVSATMAISSAVGVTVFATGGIGGVHRGVVNNWDVSADIGALKAFGQVVVCAGVKSLLDVPKTLEALETASVPVLVLRHDKFPAFYTRGSLRAPARVETEAEIARAFLTTRDGSLGLGGVLVTVPVPPEFEADYKIVETGIQKALEELEERGSLVQAGEVTPFLLKRIAELTGGASLRANMELAKNNAAVAARVCAAICEIEERRTRGGAAGMARAEVVVVGGVAVDIMCEAQSGVEMVMHVSNRGRIRRAVGGVGKNVAQAAMRFGGARVAFFSSVGDDEAGAFVRRGLERIGLVGGRVRTVPGARTASCCVVHDGKGDLALAIGDMDDMFNNSSRSTVEGSRVELEDALCTAKMACFDGNISTSDMRQLTNLCQKHSVRCWFEPTTPQKAAQLVQAGLLSALDYLSPNEIELEAMAVCVRKGIQPGDVRAAAEAVLRDGGGGGRGQCLLVTRGARGVERFRLDRGAAGAFVRTVFPAVPVGRVENTNGAGDFFAGVCMAALARGAAEDDAIRAGIASAARRVGCEGGDGAAFGRAKM